MSKTSFLLASSVSGTAQRGPEGSELQEARVPLSGHATPKNIKKKAEVIKGAVVGEHPDPDIGDKHAPVTGVVVDVDETAVVIKPQKLTPPEEEGEDDKKKKKAEPAQPLSINIGSLHGDELKQALKRLGVDVFNLFKANFLVVNGVNPEPTVTMAEQLLKERRQTLEKGLEVVKRIVNPSRTFLAAAPSNGDQVTLADSTLVAVKNKYPSGLDPLVVKAATGREAPEDATVLGVLQLYHIGRVAETNAPLAETMLTLGGIDYVVTIGVPVRELLAKANIQVGECDRVILGGPMRGQAIFDASRGVDATDYAVTIVRVDDFPPITDRQCLNCGECVLACPARIQPNMISRFVEFKMYDKAEAYHVEACMECGMCGFVCVGRRPLLQYIRLAKEELAARRLETAACAVGEE